MTNTGIHVKGIKTAAYDNAEESIFRWYADDKSLKLYEARTLTGESDFFNGRWIRESEDNGRTWSEYRDAYAEAFQTVNETDEIFNVQFEPTLYDPASGNVVTCGLQRYFIDGHIQAYTNMWGSGKADFRDHCYLVYRKPDGTLKKQFIAYEDGEDFEPENPRNPGYLDHNLAFFGNIHFASNGDLLFPIGANVRACCRILGLSVDEVFPSCPQLMAGVILVRAHWEAEKEEYTLTYSKPVVINDLQSSRGVCEPCVCELPGGRILMVFRGSNGVYPAWNSRMDPYTPGFKWFLWSEDGGKTFTPAMPWHFDSREVVYSSATISDFYRSPKTEKTYWIGNITDPTKTNGNYPRYPLVICEVDGTYGCLKKDTLTVIDTRLEGESELVQLSNFTLFENRETGNLEVRLSKFGQKTFPGDPTSYATESWMYEISFS